MHLVFFYYLYALVLRRLYAVSDAVDERYFVPTAGGARIALSRYRPRGKARNTSPILLVHGLGANRLNFDFNEDLSLARYLSSQGYDCWLVDLRGAGVSAVPHLRWTWNFDDHAFDDIPAALDFIARATRRPKVHWIGHSMGGMLLYAWLLKGNAERIESGVTLGSPVRFSPRNDGLQHMVHLRSLIRRLPLIPNALLLRLILPVIGVVDLGGMVRRQMNVRNVDFTTIRSAVYNAVEHISPGVLAQFLDWIGSGEFRSADGSYSYTRNLDQVETPLFVIAGRGDELVPACDSRLAFEQASSPVKRYLELCSADGYADDYGHIDLVFGRRARHEVFPEILDWLSAFEEDGQPASTREVTVCE